MAEPTKQPVRRIKIKFGSTVVTTQAVRVPGLVSSASHDSKDAKPGLLAQAARRQAALQGYVPPSASPDDIVARLRQGEGFAPGTELPSWDFTVAPATSSLERPAKRSRVAVSPDGACPGPSGAVSYQNKPAARGEGPSGPEAAAPGMAPPLKAGQTVERAGTTGVSGESNSDQATNSQAYLPLSPDDGGDGAGRAAGGIPQPHANNAGQSSLAWASQLGIPPPQRPRPPATAVGAGAVGTAAATAAAAAHSKAAKEHGAAGVQRPNSRVPPGSSSPVPALRDGPSTSGRQPLPAPPAISSRVASGVSVETQTLQRDFPVLPTSFLELVGLSGTAQSFNTIGPFDLQLEREQRPGTGPADGCIEAHIEQARNTKREGDALMQRQGKVWSIKSLSKYVSAALMFMEAADAMQRDQRLSHRQSRAAGLYKQTADLLAYTVANADTLKPSGLGKEALRLLAERLSAICLMRQAALQSVSYKSCADKAQAALREHHRQQAAAGLAGAGAGASAGVGGQQPSPEDSNTSSLRAAHGGGGGGAPQAAAAAGGGGPPPPAQGLAGFGHEQVAELISMAKTISKWNEIMKRSSKSFEQFLERLDVRNDQQAKLVCVHLAAVCMDMGMATGMQVIHHAKEAVRTLCEDLAR